MANGLRSPTAHRQSTHTSLPLAHHAFAVWIPNTSHAKPKGLRFHVPVELSWVESSRVELSTNTHKYEYINSLSVNYVKCRGVYFHFAIKQQRTARIIHKRTFFSFQISNRLIYILLQTDTASVNVSVCVPSISCTRIRDEHFIIISNMSIKY